MTNPTLRNWRFIGSQNGGILVGEVTNHPEIEDGWITTSCVVEISDDLTWARTQSRKYDLESPITDDQRLPPGAQNALMCRFIGGFCIIHMDDLEKVYTRGLNLIKKLSEPTGSRQ